MSSINVEKTLVVVILLVLIGLVDANVIGWPGRVIFGSVENSSTSASGGFWSSSKDRRERASARELADSFTR